MSPARARYGAPQLLVMAVLIATIALAPALVAKSVTSPAEPVPFLTEPWSGWAFATDVLRTSTSAEAASPGAAMAQANRNWRGTEPVVDLVEVQLLYLPGSERVQLRSLRPDGSRGDAEVDTPDALAWLVLGRFEPNGPTGPVGIIDFSTGRTLWDVRASGKEAGTT